MPLRLRITFHRLLQRLNTALNILQRILERIVRKCIQYSDIYEKKGAIYIYIELIRFARRLRIDGKHDDDDDEERRETVVGDDFSDITPPAYKEGAFCLSSSETRVLSTVSLVLNRIARFTLLPSSLHTERCLPFRCRQSWSVPERE